MLFRTLVSRQPLNSTGQKMRSGISPLLRRFTAVLLIAHVQASGAPIPRNTEFELYAHPVLVAANDAEGGAFSLAEYSYDLEAFAVSCGTMGIVFAVVAAGVGLQEIAAIFRHPTRVQVVAPNGVLQSLRMNPPANFYRSAAPGQRATRVNTCFERRLQRRRDAMVQDTLPAE